MAVNQSHIAIITTWYPDHPYPSSGMFVYHQAVALSQKKKVTVFIQKRGWPAQTIIDQKSPTLTEVTIKYPYLPNRSVQLLKLWAKNFENALKKHHHKDRIDIIHAHDHQAGFAAMKVSEALKVPFVCTLHNTAFLDDSIPKWKRPYIKDFIQKAHKIICVGQALKDKIEAFYGGQNVAVIPNLVDPIFKPVQMNKFDVFTFLSVGALYPKKGVVELVESFIDLLQEREAHLILIGQGNQKSLLEQMIKQAGVQHAIKIIPFVPSHELVNLYNKSHIYLSFSKYETFGVAVAEALSCGMPVVYHPSGGPEDFVPDDGSILVSERSRKARKNAMIKAMDDYKSFDMEAIANDAAKKFSPKIITQQILTSYGW